MRASGLGEVYFDLMPSVLDSWLATLPCTDLGTSFLYLFWCSEGPSLRAELSMLEEKKEDTQCVRPSKVHLRKACVDFWFQRGPVSDSFFLWQLVLAGGFAFRPSAVGFWFAGFCVVLLSKNFFVQLWLGKSGPMFFRFCSFYQLSGPSLWALSAALQGVHCEGEDSRMAVGPWTFTMRKCSRMNGRSFLPRGCCQLLHGWWRST